VTLDEALAVLDSDRTADLATVRVRYRRLVRRHHPDVAGDAGQARTAQLNLAWKVVQSIEVWSAPRAAPAPAAASTAPRAPSGSRPRPRLRDQPNVVPLPAPTRAVFDRLAEAADRLGDISYLDRQDGILETIIRPEGGPSCSLMLTIRQQGDDTLAECVLESLEGRPAPPIEEVVAALTKLLPEDW
jgi:hypothetical protein